MSSGLLNEYFNETEADFRQERLTTESFRKPRLRRNHHLPWPLHRGTTHNARHHQPVVN